MTVLCVACKKASTFKKRTPQVSVQCPHCHSHLYLLVVEP